MAELTVVGYRLYKRDPQEVVTEAVAEIPAKVEFRSKVLSGYYPQRNLSTANVGPGIPNGNAGVPLLGPGSSTWVGLKYELLTNSLPPEAIVSSPGAGLSVFGGLNSGGVGGIGGSGTSLFGGPGAGVSVFTGQYSAPPPTIAPALFWVYLTGQFDNVPANIAAVAGRPAVTRSVGSHGWDAGALSAKSFMGDGYVTFRAQPGAEVLGGLQVGPDSLDFAAPAYQFLLDSFFGLAYARGAAGGYAAAAPGTPVGGGSIPPAYENTLFTVRKRGLAVEYVTDRGAGPVVVFATTVPEALRYEVFSLGAVLYDPGTYVEGVAVYQYVISEGVLPALAGIAVGGPAVSGSDGVLPALAGIAGGSLAVSVSNGVLPALAGIAGVGSVPSGSNGVLPALTGVAGVGSVAGGGSNGVLPALTGSGKVVVIGGGSNGVLPALTGRGWMASTSAGILPALIGAGGRISVSSAGVLPKLGGWASTEAAVLSSRSAGVLPALRGRGFSLVGTVGFSDAALPRLIGSGGRPIAISLGTMPNMVGYGSGLDNGYVTMFTHLLNISPITTGFQLAVVMDSSGAITTVVGVARISDGGLNTSAAVSDSTVLSIALAAYMDTQIVAGVVTPLYEQGGSVWAVNLSESFATSTFENYGFNSFGVIGGRAFGAKVDGLFLLEGDTDDGLPIRASVSYGKQDFGTKTDKRMISAYVGASSTGKLYLKIISESGEYIYIARSSSGRIQQQRFDIGRGLAGTYFTFELFNKNGGDFEIDSVTFVAADFKRRI